MRIVFMSGNHPRHAFVANKIEQSGDLAGLIIERREEMVPTPPDDIPDKTKLLFAEHFRRRAAAEAQFFEGGEFPTSCPLLEVSLSELNSDKVVKLLNEIAPDLVLSYGIHKLSDEVLAATPGEKWNIHGGLSPWYRGVATHFWPSYLLEPQMTGLTIHETTAAIDGGSVVHQIAAPMVRGDGLHHVACRAVYALGDEMADFLGYIRKIGGAKDVVKHAQATTGRIWRNSDWHPYHLHLIYDFYDDAIVDLYLDNQLSGTQPRLHRQSLDG